MIISIIIIVVIIISISSSSSSYQQCSYVQLYIYIERERQIDREREIQQQRGCLGACPEMEAARAFSFEGAQCQPSSGVPPCESARPHRAAKGTGISRVERRLFMSSTAASIYVCYYIHTQNIRIHTYAEYSNILYVLLHTYIHT